MKKISEEFADRIAQEFADNLNRNVVAQCVLDEMAVRQGQGPTGPELSWNHATQDFRQRFLEAYRAMTPDVRMDAFVTAFVDAWPDGMGVLHMDPKWKGILAQPPYTKDGLWPAPLPRIPRSET